VAKKLLRDPAVKNKYRLNTRILRKLQVGDRAKVCAPAFWRNEQIQAWCVSRAVGDDEFGDATSFWIGIYDEDASSYAGKVRFSFSTYGGMCGYGFKEFFQPEDIECEDDLKIQELFLGTINSLIDEGILVIPEEFQKRAPKRTKK
jgi:hypothetical protein